MVKARALLWKVLLIGDGPMRAAIEAEVERLGLVEDVRITGDPAMCARPWRRATSWLSSRSSIESFSIAALEAMALAKPILMSEVGGAAEQIEPGGTATCFRPTT